MPKRGDLAIDPPIMGRNLELGLVESLVERLREGFSGAAVIEGEAGIGKSTLAAIAAKRSQAAGVRVLQGDGDELDQERPFGLVSDMVGTLEKNREPQAQRLVDLLFPQDPKERPDLLQSAAATRLEDELVDLVEVMASSGPLLLILEDVHWADAASLKAMKRVTRRLSELPLGLVVSSRNTRRPEVARFISALVEQQAAHLILPALDTASLAGIAEAEFGRPPGTNLLENLRRTGGNPFLATQLLRAYRQDDLLDTSANAVDVAADAFPPSVSGIILRRVQTLGEGAYAQLRRAAILGRTFSIRDLESISSSSRAEILETIEAAIGVGLLRDDGDRVAFHHDLVREVLYLDVPEAVRRELHRDVALALADRGGSALTVASHISHSPQHGDPFDIGWLNRAAAEAAAGDPAVAASLMKKAIDLSDEDDPALSKMRAEHLEMTLWAGDSVAAEEVAREYLQLPMDPADERSIRYSLVRALTAQSRFAEALVEVNAAIDQGPGPGAATLKAEGAFTHTFGGMLDRGVELAHEAMQEAEGDDFAVAAASWALSLILAAKGEAARAVDWAERGLQGATLGRNSAFSRGPLLSMAAGTLFYCEEIERSEEVLRTGIELLNEAGTAWMMSVFHAGLGHIRTATGRWDDALAEFETSARLAEENENTAPIAGVRAVQAQILSRRGDMDAAATALRDGQRLVDQAGGVHFNGPDVARAHAALLEMEGDVEQALAILSNLWQMTSMLGMTGFAVVAATEVALLGTRHRRPEVVEQVAPSLEVTPEQVPATTHAATLCARGCLRSDTGLIEQGVSHLRSGRNVLGRALWYEEAAHALRHADSVRSRELFLAAADTYEELGDVHDLARLKARARDAGVRLSATAGRMRPKSGWASLTKTELAIARLVHEGLRNSEVAQRLVVSPRTVETHLTAIYRKLRIRSRSQLVRLAGEHKPSGTPPSG